MAAFLDTNVLVYCSDPASPGKQRAARALVQRLSEAGEAMVSTQVLIELFHTLTRKQKVPAPTAQAVVKAFAEWPVIDSDVTLVEQAIASSLRHQLSIWDAMVVQAALRAGADTLYSEDLQDGQRFGALTVVNPFRA